MIRVVNHYLSQHLTLIWCGSKVFCSKPFVLPTETRKICSTHQLDPKNYYEDCRKIAFKLIDQWVLILFVVKG